MSRSTPFRLAPITLAVVVLCTTAASSIAQNASTSVGPAPAASHQAASSTLPEIAVTGTADNDPTTENTGNYRAKSTNTATKLNLTPRETPQSVSVITRTQMEDFGLQSATDALTYSTGVNVERVETERTYYSVRGFDVANFQLDGVGLPFATGEQLGDIDTAIYDRIEVLRGANGLMTSTGNPSATVNFVRKRPTAGLQASAGVTLGSWNNRRLDGDISGALNESGSVRGRLVAATQSKDSYLDRYSLNKNIFSGVIEADLSDSTLFTIGHMQQKNKTDSPMWGATPLYYTNGQPTDYDRSFSTAAEWAYWDTDDKQTFAELEHQLGGNWSAKVSLNRRTLASDGKMFFVAGNPDATTGLGLSGYTSKYDHNEEQTMLDAYVSGPFTFAGRKHELVLGANWSRSENEMLSRGNGLYVPLPDIENWAGQFPESTSTARTGFGDFTDRRRSLYAAARFNPTDRLKFIAGVNSTHVESKGEQYGEAHQYSKTKMTPYFGTVYDLDPRHSVYASYAEIFNPQHKIDGSHAVLPPIEGSNLEAGVKGEWLDKRLNASFAVFQAKQNNLGEYDSTDPVTNESLYKGIDATSTGFEFDIAGQISKNWQVSAGYTQLRLKDADGNDTRTYVPRRTAHLSSTYQAPNVSGLKIGASLRWQDDIKRDQGAKDLSGNDIVTRQKAYALLNLMAQYQIDKNLTATVNLNNVTDKKYINSLYWDQGFYGAPRNISASLNWKY